MNKIAPLVSHHQTVNLNWKLHIKYSRREFPRNFSFLTSHLRICCDATSASRLLNIKLLKNIFQFFLSQALFLTFYHKIFALRSSETYENILLSVSSPHSTLENQCCLYHVWDETISKVFFRLALKPKHIGSRSRQCVCRSLQHVGFVDVSIAAEAIFSTLNLVNV